MRVDAPDRRNRPASGPNRTTAFTSPFGALRESHDQRKRWLAWRTARERIAKAYDFLDETTKIDIYGRPSDALVDQIRQMGMGAPVRFNVATGGFSRLASVGA